MTVRKSTSRIVVHCSATPAGMDVGVKEIRVWHMQRGFIDVGYHLIIRRNGEVETGRNLLVPGAHAKGYNHDSIGICMVGGVNDDGQPEDNFTDEQWASLKSEVARLLKFYYDRPMEVLGHRDLEGVSKACPSFDVREWFAREFSDDTAST